MIAGFVSQSGTSYLYDSVTNQIVRYDGPALSDDGARGPALDAALARLGIDPRATVPLAAAPSAEVMAAWLERGWKTLNLCASEDCNNRCTYCLHSGLYPYERRHRPRSMSLETARKALDLYLAHAGGVKRKRVTLFGGEPLLNWPLVVDVVEQVEARAPGTQLQICTNGQLLDETRAAYAVAHDICLSISLDGPQEVHDAWRVTGTGRGTWARVMSVLEHIRQLSPRYYESQVRLVCTVAPPYNLPDLAAFFDAHPFLRSRLFRVTDVEDNDNEFLTSMAPDEREELEDTRRAHAEALRRDFVSAARAGDGARHLGALVFGPTLRLIHSRTMQPGPLPALLGACIPGVQQVYVSVDGCLYPCQTCGSGSFMPIGTLEHGIDVQAVIGHVERFRAGCLEMCGQCWCSRFCRHCYISGRVGDHVDDARTRSACEVTRRRIRSGLEIYASVLEARPDAFDFLCEPPPA